MKILWTILASYLLIGLTLLLLGPLGKALRHSVDEMRSDAQRATVLNGKEPTPAWKFVAFGVLMGLSSWVAWPILLPGAIADLRSRIPRSRPPGRYFSTMGGAGTLTCDACEHAEEVVSFLHGASWSRSGFQCQQCARFHAIDNYGESEAVPRCECGGKLSRDEVLVCPKCHSKDLRYELSFIT